MKYLLWTHAGMGDMVYLYAIAKWMMRKGLDVAVQTHVPEMFDSLGIDCLSFSTEVDPAKYYLIKGDYFKRKQEKDTNQFEDMLIEMGIRERVPLVLEYDHTFVRYKLNVSKPICIVKHPRYKIAGGYDELASNEKYFQHVIDAYRNDFYFIQVGMAGDDIYMLKDLDLNLVGKTSIYDLMYLVDRAALVVTRTGHLLPMAEAFGTKVVCILAKKLARARNDILNTITPEKIKCGESSTIIWDDDNFIREKIDAFIKAPKPKAVVNA